MSSVEETQQFAAYTTKTVVQKKIRDANKQEMAPTHLTVLVHRIRVELDRIIPIFKKINKKIKFSVIFQIFWDSFEGTYDERYVKNPLEFIYRVSIIHK